MIRDTALTCALCLRRGDASILHAQRSVCRACVRTLVRVVVDDRWRKRLWQVDPIETQSRGVASQQHATEFWEEISREWLAVPLDSIEPSAETRVDLAVAYREMGLLEAALEQAATALADPELADHRATEAIRLLLESAALRLSVDETLSTIRTEYFPN